MNNHTYFQEEWNLSKESECISLLKECVYFMNNIPNHSYQTKKEDKNHYELCSRIERFLNEI